MTEDNQKGLFGKYLIAKADGTPLDPEALYFVIRYDAGATHGHAGRRALVAYCRAIESEMPELAQDLRAAMREECVKACESLGAPPTPNPDPEDTMPAS